MKLLVDGNIVSNDSWTLSPLDRAVLYGESAFELLRVYSGRPFELGLHLDCLGRACAQLSIPWPGAEVLRAEVATAIDGGAGDLALRVQLTRGNPALEISPRRVVSASAAVVPARHAYERGVAVVIDAALLVRPEAYFAALKWGGYGAHMKALERARAGGAEEALAVDSAGAVVEGATSNLFALIGAELVTAAEASGVRAGITRAVVLDRAVARGVTVRQSAISLRELMSAREVFVTSSIRELLPVARIDGVAVGDGRFELTRALHRDLRVRACAAGPMPWEM